MLIKSLSLKCFQQFHDPFLINNLADNNFNIICGRNEAGKSTLVRAARAVFFERFDGKVCDEYASKSGRFPEVEVEFGLKGIDYILKKIFAKKSKHSSAVLHDITNDHEWIDNEAENKLIEIFGFEENRKKPDSAKHGIFSLLWIDQDSNWRNTQEPSESAIKTLGGVLNKELTAILTQGKGQTLLEKFTHELEDYQSDKQEIPRNDYSKLIDKANNTRCQLQDFKTEFEKYETNRNKLAKDNAEKIVLDESINKLKDNLEILNKKIDNGTQLKNDYDKVVQENKILEQSIFIKRNDLTTYNSLVSQINNSKQRITVLNQQLKPTKDELNSCEAKKLQLEKELELAKQVLDDSKNQVTLSRNHDDLLIEKGIISKISEEIKKIKNYQKELSLHRENLAQIQINKANFDKLEDLNSTIRDLETKLQATAPIIEYSIGYDDEVYLNNELIKGNSRQVVTKSMEFKFDNSKINFSSANEELKKLEQETDVTKAALKRMLESSNVKSIGEAKNLFTRRTGLERTIQIFESIIQDSELENKEKELAEHIGRELYLNKIGSTVKTLTLDEAINLENGADQIFQKTHDSLTRIDSTILSKSKDIIIIAKEIKSFEERIIDSENQLQALQSTFNKEVVEDEIKDNEDSLKEGNAKLNKLKQDLDIINLESLQLDKEKFIESLRNSSLMQDNLKEEIITLKAELSLAGQNGLAEKITLTEQSLKNAENEIMRIQNHIGALKLLCKIIAEELKETKDLLIKPISDALQCYLPILFPDTALNLADDFCMKEVKRNTNIEPYSQLSMGTREQLAIILRLAFADVLVENGMSVTVVLDDALVNCDDDRRELMKTIIYRASKKYPIILLTCHKSAYLNTHGKIHDI